MSFENLFFFLQSFILFRRISELEGTEIHTKQEIARLREISEVATYQVGAINDMKVLDEKEFQSLRLQLLDLQAKSDDKNEIGKLHRHILALQISEATAKRRQLQSDNDLAKQKALLLRTEQKLDEKEQSLFFIRQEYTQRIRYLRTALQVNFYLISIY
jgi:centrosomal protein CEP290